MSKPTDALSAVARRYETIAKAMERTAPPAGGSDGCLTPAAYYARLYATRYKAATLRALIAAFEQSWPDEPDDPRVVVCAGPPACLLMGDEAVAAAKAGCVWCRRIVCHSDGTETVTGPNRC